MNRWKTSADEVILKIFSYLKRDDLIRCSLVCRQWHSLAYDRQLWTWLNFSQRTVPVDKLTTLLSFGVKYLSLSCSDLKTSSSDSLNNKKTKLHLQYADFGLCNISGAHLARILECCPNLRKLNLEFLVLSSTILKAISMCSQLRILNLSMCQEVNQSQLVSITRKCELLEELNLGWCDIEERTFSKLFPGRS